MNFFSSRSWTGLVPTAATFVSCAVVFDLFTWLAWHSDQGRTFDLLAFALGFPSVLLALLLAAAFAWSLAGRVPYTQALGWAIRFLPLAWVVPLIDFVRTTGSGVSALVPQLNGSGLLFAMLTGGVFPFSSGLPIGIRFGLVAGSFAVAIVSWHFSKKWIQSILSGVWFSIIGICSMSSLSFALFWSAPFIRSSWTALPGELLRKSSSLLGRGYWWDAMYDRFPTAIDGQIDIASRLFSVAGALFVVLILLIMLFLKEKVRRALIIYACRSWSAALYGIALIVGLIFGYASRSLGSNMAFLPAYLFFLYVIFALRISSVIRRDISNLEQDERAGIHQPITDGTLTLEHAKLIAMSAEWSAVAAAWMLGWPVLIAAGVYLACAKLSRDRLWSVVDQMPTLFRVIGSAALAAFAFLFLTQEIHLTTRLLMAMGVAAAIRLLIEWFWIPRFKGVGRRA